MRPLTKTAKLLVVVTLCFLLLSACAEKQKKVKTIYGDIAYDTVEYVGFKDGFTVKDDEKYFLYNDLLVIVFKTYSDIKHTVTDIEVRGNSMQVSISQNRPHAVEFLEVNRGIFIDIPKGNVPEDVAISVEIIE